MLAYYLHDLDPIIFRVYDNIGPRWYGLAYVLGFICGYVLLVLLAKRGYADISVTFSSTNRKCCASHCRFCGCGKAECPATAV